MTIYDMKIRKEDYVVSKHRTKNQTRNQKKRINDSTGSKGPN